MPIMATTFIRKLVHPVSEYKCEIAPASVGFMGFYLSSRIFRSNREPRTMIVTQSLQPRRIKYG
jgi:hypothetical protein